MSDVYVLIKLCELVTPDIQSAEDVEDAADIIQSRMGFLSVFMCMGFVLGLANIVLLFGIAGVTLTIWKDSKRDRDAKESIAIIACAITILLLTIGWWFLPLVAYPFIGLFSAAAYIGILISLAILVNRWQNIRQRFVLKNVFWIAGGMALGSLSVTFAISILQMVSILDLTVATPLAFILPTISRLMMIGSTCILGFVCLGLVSQRNR